MRKITTICCLLVVNGCSAAYWGGEDAGRTPGLHMKNTIFGPQVALTGNTNASVEEITYDFFNGWGVKNLKFDQDSSTVIGAQVPKLDAIARVQDSQGRYAEITWGGITDVFREIAPILKLLAAGQFQTTSSGLQMTLPGGFGIGQTRETTMADAAELLRNIEPFVPTPAPTTQPSE